VTRTLLVLLDGAAWRDRYQAVTVAATAAALGEKVVVALFFEPLRRWVEGGFDEGAPLEAPGAKVGSLAEALVAARALGLEVVACDTAVRLAGLGPEAVRPRVDRIASLPALWAEAREGRVVRF
jgi:peroxiredoxin family protein